MGTQTDNEQTHRRACGTAHHARLFGTARTELLTFLPETLALSVLRLLGRRLLPRGPVRDQLEVVIAAGAEVAPRADAQEAETLCVRACSRNRQVKPASSAMARRKTNCRAKLAKATVSSSAKSIST